MKRLTIFFLLIFSFIFCPNIIYNIKAEDATSGIEKIITGLETAGGAEGAGLTAKSVPEMVSNTIKIVMGITGTIMLIMIVIGGVMWMTSGGQKKQIETARKLMTSSAIGIIIIAAAYAITDFIIKQIISVAG